MTTLETFCAHAARAFFASAWADACDESDNAPSLSGCEIMDVMPSDIDPAAVHAARTLYMDIARANEKSIDALMSFIVENGQGDRPNTAEYFGHYAAMQAMGHGVGLLDAFGSIVCLSIKVPYIEFGPHSLSKDYF